MVYAISVTVQCSLLLSMIGKMCFGLRQSKAPLEKRLSVLRKKIADTGTVWVSWPKKSYGVPTDVTEDVVRAVALPLGFVDVKVCAIDETWSGLKLMVRRTNRKPAFRK